jgi:hypothetical protein
VRAFGNDSATAEALSLLHNVQLGPRDAEARLELAESIIHAAARAGDELLQLMGLCWRTVDLFLLGNPRARQSLTELREQLAIHGCEALSYTADVLEAMLLARAGQLIDAEEAANLALKRGAEVGDPDAANCYGALVIAMRWWQGRADEITELVGSLSTATEMGLNDHAYIATFGLMSACIGDVESAEESLAMLRGRGLGQLPYSSTWLATQALVVETAYLLGDAQTAAEAGELIAPFAHLPVMPSLAVVCLGSAERALGLSAMTTGRVDAAIHHLEAAVSADRQLGNRPVRALTQHTLAAALQLRGHPSDLMRADQLAREADDRARRIGISLAEHPPWLFAPPVTRGRGFVRNAIIERTNTGWRVEVDRRTTMLRDRVGFLYLAKLVMQPGRNVAAIALASDDSGILQARNLDPVVDEAALAQYRRRANELAALLEVDDVDPRDADRYRAELDLLSAEIRSATGVNGKSRSFTDNSERARTAVRKALLRATAAIAASEPDLAAHLDASLDTGVVCRYKPEPGWAVTGRMPNASGNGAGKGRDTRQP